MTFRETEILLELGNPHATRHDNKYIAEKLGITTDTLKVYISRLRLATGRDRIGLALMGYILDHPPAVCAHTRAQNQQPTIS